MIGLDNLDGVINIIREASSNANALAGLVSGKFLSEWMYFLSKLSTMIYFSGKWIF